MDIRKVIAKLSEIERVEIVGLLLGLLLMHVPLGGRDIVGGFLAFIGFWTVLAVALYHFLRI